MNFFDESMDTSLLNETQPQGSHELGQNGVPRSHSTFMSPSSTIIHNEAMSSTGVIPLQPTSPQHYDDNKGLNSQQNDTLSGLSDAMSYDSISSTDLPENSSLSRNDLPVPASHMITSRTTSMSALGTTSTSSFARPRRAIPRGVTSRGFAPSFLRDQDDDPSFPDTNAATTPTNATTTNNNNTSHNNNLSNPSKPNAKPSTSIFSTDYNIKSISRQVIPPSSTSSRHSTANNNIYTSNASNIPHPFASMLSFITQSKLSWREMVNCDQDIELISYTALFNHLLRGNHDLLVEFIRSELHLEMYNWDDKLSSGTNDVLYDLSHTSLLVTLCAYHAIYLIQLLATHSARVQDDTSNTNDDNTQEQFNSDNTGANNDIVLPSSSTTSAKPPPASSQFQRLLNAVPNVAPPRYILPDGIDLQRLEMYIEHLSNQLKKLLLVSCLSTAEQQAYLEYRQSYYDQIVVPQQEEQRKLQEQQQQQQKSAQNASHDASIEILRPYRPLSKRQADLESANNLNTTQSSANTTIIDQESDDDDILPMHFRMFSQLDVNEMIVSMETTGSLPIIHFNANQADILATCVNFITRGIFVPFSPLYFPLAVPQISSVLPIVSNLAINVPSSQNFIDINTVLPPESEVPHSTLVDKAKISLSPAMLQRLLPISDILYAQEYSFTLFLTRLAQTPPHLPSTSHSSSPQSFSSLPNARRQVKVVLQLLWFFFSRWFLPFSLNPLALYNAYKYSKDNYQSLGLRPVDCTVTQYFCPPEYINMFRFVSLQVNIMYTTYPIIRHDTWLFEPKRSRQIDTLELTRSFQSFQSSVFRTISVDSHHDDDSTTPSPISASARCVQGYWDQFLFRNIHNLTSDFSDGVIFCLLIHAYLPKLIPLTSILYYDHRGYALPITYQMSEQAHLEITKFTATTIATTTHHHSSHDAELEMEAFKQFSMGFVIINNFALFNHALSVIGHVPISLHPELSLDAYRYIHFSFSLLTNSFDASSTARSKASVRPPTTTTTSTLIPPTATVSSDNTATTKTPQETFVLPSDGKHPTLPAQIAPQTFPDSALLPPYTPSTPQQTYHEIITQTIAQITTAHRGLHQLTTDYNKRLVIISNEPLQNSIPAQRLPALSNTQYSHNGAPTASTNPSPLVQLKPIDIASYAHHYTLPENSTILLLAFLVERLTRLEPIIRSTRAVERLRSINSRLPRRLALWREYRQEKHSMLNQQLGLPSWTSEDQREEYALIVKQRKKAHKAQLVRAAAQERDNIQHVRQRQHSRKAAFESELIDFNQSMMETTGLNTSFVSKQNHQGELISDNDDDDDTDDDDDDDDDDHDTSHSSELQTQHRPTTTTTKPTTTTSQPNSQNGQTNRTGERKPEQQESEQDQPTEEQQTEQQQQSYQAHHSDHQPKHRVVRINLSSPQTQPNPLPSANPRNKLNFPSSAGQLFSQSASSQILTDICTPFSAAYSKLSSPHLALGMSMPYPLAHNMNPIIIQNMTPGFSTPAVASPSTTTTPGVVSSNVAALYQHISPAVVHQYRLASEERTYWQHVIATGRQPDNVSTMSSPSSQSPYPAPPGSASLYPPSTAQTPHLPSLPQPSQQPQQYQQPAAPAAHQPQQPQPTPASTLGRKIQQKQPQQQQQSTPTRHAEQHQPSPTDASQVDQRPQNRLRSRLLQASAQQHDFLVKTVSPVVVITSPPHPSQFPTSQPAHASGTALPSVPLPPSSTAPSKSPSAHFQSPVQMTTSSSHPSTATSTLSPSGAAVPLPPQPTPTITTTSHTPAPQPTAPQPTSNIPRLVPKSDAIPKFPPESQSSSYFPSISIPLPLTRQQRAAEAAAGVLDSSSPATAHAATTTTAPLRPTRYTPAPRAAPLSKEILPDPEASLPSPTRYVPQRVTSPTQKPTPTTHKPVVAPVPQMPPPSPQQFHHHADGSMHLGSPFDCSFVREHVGHLDPAVADIVTQLDSHFHSIFSHQAPSHQFSSTTTQDTVSGSHQSSFPTFERQHYEQEQLQQQYADYQQYQQLQQQLQQQRQFQQSHRQQQQQQQHHQSQQNHLAGRAHQPTNAFSSQRHQPLPISHENRSTRHTVSHHQQHSSHHFNKRSINAIIRVQALVRGFLTRRYIDQREPRIRIIRQQLKYHTQSIRFEEQALGNGTSQLIRVHNFNTVVPTWISHPLFIKWWPAPIVSVLQTQFGASYRDAPHILASSLLARADRSLTQVKHSEVLSSLIHAVQQLDTCVQLAGPHITFWLVHNNIFYYLFSLMYNCRRDKNHVVLLIYCILLIYRLISVNPSLITPHVFFSRFLNDVYLPPTRHGTSSTVTTSSSSTQSNVQEIDSTLVILEIMQVFRDQTDIFLACVSILHLGCEFAHDTSYNLVDAQGRIVYGPSSHTRHRSTSKQIQLRYIDYIRSHKDVMKRLETLYQLFDGKLTLLCDDQKHKSYLLSQLPYADISSPHSGNAVVQRRKLQKSHQQQHQAHSVRFSSLESDPYVSHDDMGFVRPPRRRPGSANSAFTGLLHQQDVNDRTSNFSDIDDEYENDDDVDPDTDGDNNYGYSNKIIAGFSYTPRKRRKEAQNSAFSSTLSSQRQSEHALELNPEDLLAKSPYLMRKQAKRNIHGNNAFATNPFELDDDDYDDSGAFSSPSAHQRLDTQLFSPLGPVSPQLERPHENVLPHKQGEPLISSDQYNIDDVFRIMASIKRLLDLLD